MNSQGQRTWKWRVSLLLFFHVSLICALHPNERFSDSIQAAFSSLEAKHLNLGLHNVVVQEHWDKQTLIDEPPPTLYAESMQVNLTGKTMLSWEKSEPINCYQGIRYGQKPKRFTPALLVEYPNPEYKDDMYVADHLPDKCMQHGIFAHNVPAGTEDCLYLNVYTPVTPDATSNNYTELLPVMIFFHGGAFIWGDSSLYLPTRLCEEGVILVVPHYRLGSLGFFTTMDYRAPGNTGLYDQQLAMRWVQEHIMDFGGDKDKVTIFGQSAGSASVNYHLLSPASKGLFKNVIGESGDAMEHWALDPDPMASAFAMAELLDCNPRANIDDIYNCMMAADAGELALKINELSLNDRLSGQMGFRGTAPIIQNSRMDLSRYGVDVLIAQQPKKYFTNQEFNTDVNLMIGANKQEGSFIFGIMLTSYIVPHNLTDNPIYIKEQMISDLLYSFGIEDTSHSLAESLAEQYLKGADRTNLDSCTPGMIDLSGVLFMKSGTLETVKLHSYYKKDTSNTYLYAFEYNSEDTSFDWLFMGHMDAFSDSFIKGVTHSDELLYIFSWPAVIDGEQIPVKNKLIKMWTNFAKYGNPTPDEDTSYLDLGIPTLSNYDIVDEKYMLMEGSFVEAQHYESRWTITNDEVLMGPQTTTISTTKATTKDPIRTTTTEKATTPEKPPTGVSQEEYDSLKKERDAYMATMIVFLILFVIAAGLAGFMFYKWKNFIA